MAEIVNLRRARKTKQRASDAKHADTNRVSHGVAKNVKTLAKARADKEKRAVEAHRLNDD